MRSWMDPRTERDVRDRPRKKGRRGEETKRAGKTDAGFIGTTGFSVHPKLT